MSDIRRISIPPVPGSFPQEQRAFLESLRSGLLASGGQTAVSRKEDKANVAKREVRDILPGMVELLVKEGLRDILLDYFEDRQDVFVQDDAPDFKGQTGIWVQTGLGDGSGMTIWVEDGK